MKVPLVWLKDYIDIQKSPKEIADSFTSLGLMLDKPIEGAVLDLEHRFDRSDWLSVIGCARDLAAFEGLKLKLPEKGLALKAHPSRSGDVEIKVKCPDLVNRFNTRVFRGVKVGESPEWLRERLESYGIPSINNIVDITNFVMVEYGQPMHAQDLAKFEKQEIVIRRAREGEEITTLLGDLVKLDPEMFILTQNDKPIAIGGVVGGQITAIDKSTTDIILDAGNYNHANIRKTSRKLKIQNETVLRYDKILHPQLTQEAIDRATYLILKLTGGKCYENEDYYPKEFPIKEMRLRESRIKKVSGMHFETPKVKEILTTLGYEVTNEDKGELDLKVPYFRTDVVVEDDIVSDIVRISNFENVPLEQIQAPPPKEATPEIYKFEEKIRDALVNLGLHEHITSPLVKLDPEKDKQVFLENALSSEQNALRTTMTETLSPVLDIYRKHGIDEIGVFDVGLIYENTGDGDKFEDFKETRVVGVVYQNPEKPQETNKKVKRILSGFLRELGIENVEYKLDKTPTERTAKIFQEGLELGELGVLSFALLTENLLKAQKSITRVKSEMVSKIIEDITIALKPGEAVGPIVNKIKSVDERVASVEIIDEYITDRGKNTTFRITFVAPDGETLTTEKISEIKDQIL